MEQNQFLEKLNNINVQKTFMRLSEMELGKAYLITDAEGIDTKYGYKTSLEIDNKFKIILPDKYNKLLNWADDRAKMVGLKMVYKGTKEIGGCKKVHDIEFIF